MSMEDFPPYTARDLEQFIERIDATHEQVVICGAVFKASAALQMCAPEYFRALLVDFATPPNG